MLEQVANEISFAVESLERELARRAAEHAAAATELRYRSLFANMEEGFAYCAIVLEDGRPVDFEYLEVNQAFTKLTGLGHAVGRRVLEAFPGLREDDGGLIARLGNVALSGEPDRLEIFLRPLDRWFSISAYCPEPDCFAAVFEDITEKKRANQALQTAHARLRRLVDSSLIGVLIASPAGRVLEANDYYLRLIGVSRAEFEAGNLDWREFTPSEELEIEKNALAEVIARGSCEPYQRHSVRRDGTRVPVLFALTRLPSPDDHIAGFVLDLSHREEAAKLVSDALHFNETLIESLPIGVLAYDATGRCFAANEAVAKMVGGTREQLLVQNFHAIASWRETGMLAAAEEALAEMKGRELEVDLASSFGARVRVGCRFVPIIYGGKKLLLVVLVDVTARHAAEKRIHEQAELIDKANEAIIAGDLDGRISLWSRGAQRLFGWTADEVVGRSVHEVLSLAGIPPSAAIHTAVASADDWRGEVAGRNRDGTPLVVEASITILRDATGAPTGRLGICTDITEKKKLADQFLRAQRLESIGMLAAGIAHDLNNVLAPVGMASSLLQSQIKDPYSLRLLETLQKCSDRGARLVRQILGFAHGISGEPQLAQVKHLIRDIVEVISQTFPKSIAIEDDVPSDLWPVIANPTQVHQVLLNLCVNARDAMPQGGTLRLRGENVRLDESAAAQLRGGKPGTWLVLHVEDTGSGIPPEILARIWDPFFTTKSSDRGTGLGLSTVKGIVEAHHGFITVVSNIGRGTTFRIYLPAAETGVAATENVVRSFPRCGKGELILLVDDEPSIRDSVGALLRRAGYSVVTASDGAQAASKFHARAAEIALVITDVDMPVLGGKDLANIIHARNPAMKILAISGLQDLRTGSENSAGGYADAFVAKPFTTDRFLHCVTQLLGTEPSRN